MKEDPETQKAVKAAMMQHAKLVIGDEAHRQQEAMRAVQNVLNKYQVALVPTVMLRPQGMEFMIETVCIPPEEVARRAAKQKEMEDARKAGQVRKESQGEPEEEGEKG